MRLEINEVATFVLQLRESKQLTRKQFGLIVSESEQNVYNVETGRSKISLRRLQKICDPFKIKISYWIVEK
jgi:transcriptional regulator with XRE-family HTH domain